MTGYVSQALRTAAKEVAVRFYAPGTDPYFEELVKNADRASYFDEESRAETKVLAKARPGAQRNQTTLEAFT
jgi:hypothetical protein